MKRPPKRRPKEWTLAQVRRACPSAPVVWVGLCDMAEERGSILVTPTRESLAAVTGIKKPATISAGLTVLTKAQWINRTHVSSSQKGQRTTLLRIVLRRSARKTASTGHTAVAPGKRPDSRGRKRGADSSFRRGRVRKTTPRPAEAGRSPDAPGSPHTPHRERQSQKRLPGEEEHPSVRIERERMEAIRAERVASA